MRAAVILIFDKCLYLRGRLRLTAARRLSAYMLSRALATTTASSCYCFLISCGRLSWLLVTICVPYRIVKIRRWLQAKFLIHPTVFHSLFLCFSTIFLGLLPNFTEFTEGHQYRRTDGLVGTALMPYKAHCLKYQHFMLFSILVYSKYEIWNSLLNYM